MEHRRDLPLIAIFLVSLTLINCGSENTSPSHSLQVETRAEPVKNFEVFLDSENSSLWERTYQFKDQEVRIYYVVRIRDKGATRTLTMPSTLAAVDLTAAVSAKYHQNLSASFKVRSVHFDQILDATQRSQEVIDQITTVEVMIAVQPQIAGFDNSTGIPGIYPTSTARISIHTFRDSALVESKFDHHPKLKIDDRNHLNVIVEKE